MTKIDVATLSNMDLLGLIESASVELKDREYHRGLTLTVEDEQGTVEHEGLILRKVDRVAREGDYIRANNQRNFQALDDGKIYGPVTLEGEELLIDDGFHVYVDYHNRTPETVEVFEVIGYVDFASGEDFTVEASVPKSANQQRAELIQRAREFVEVKLESLKDSTEIDGGYEFKRRENPNHCSFVTKANFVVNHEKRTVVALLKLKNDKEIRNIGIAKCMPGEVFNAEIGKAIALARALEIEIPQEFLQAVQPDEFAVGQVTVSARSLSPLPSITRIDKTNECAWTGETRWDLDSIAEGYAVILDDTNAQYEEVAQ